MHLHPEVAVEIAYYCINLGIFGEAKQWLAGQVPGKLHCRAPLIDLPLSCTHSPRFNFVFPNLTVVVRVNRLRRIISPPLLLLGPAERSIPKNATNIPHACLVPHFTLTKLAKIGRVIGVVGTFGVHFSLQSSF